VIVVVTDDFGYGDLGIYGVLADVRTPHLDRLAREGALFTNGYSTAPQCSPSRAGLLTGKYQQRFGYDHNGLGPLPLEERTLADRLKEGGYATGLVGKWHLEPNWTDKRWAAEHYKQPIDPKVRLPHEVLAPYLPGGRGFEEFYCGELAQYVANFDRTGKSLSPDGEVLNESGFRVDVQTQAALAFLSRQGQRPFFLYLSYYAPHVPLAAPPEYLARFPGEMPERRRYALAMIAAVDEGLGRIVEALEKRGQRENTLIFFVSDNGAPLGVNAGSFMQDVKPVAAVGPYWDGSRNDPLRGEKGMLSEGGIRVPFIVSWPARIREGQVISQPVSTLDIASTSVAAAGLPADRELDGVDLTPWLTGVATGAPHDALYWRFWSQEAVRSGDWKLVRLGTRMSSCSSISPGTPARTSMSRHSTRRF
jgi:arylsulfatase A-like enzyme